MSANTATRPHSRGRTGPAGRAGEDARGGSAARRMRTRTHAARDLGALNGCHRRPGDGPWDAMVLFRGGSNFAVRLLVAVISSGTEGPVHGVVPCSLNAVLLPVNRMLYHLNVVACTCSA